MVTMQRTAQSLANTLVNAPSNLTPAPVPPPHTNPTANVLLTDGNNVASTVRAGESISLETPVTGNNIRSTSNPNPKYHDPQDEGKYDGLTEIMVKAADKAMRQEQKMKALNKLEYLEGFTTASESSDHRVFSENPGKERYRGASEPRLNGESFENFNKRNQINSFDTPRSTNGRPLTPGRTHYTGEARPHSPTPTSRAAKNNPFAPD